MKKKKRIAELEEEVDRLLRENSRLREDAKVLHENGKRNREWCDEATNFLGPWAKIRYENLTAVNNVIQSLRGELLEMQDAYHVISGKWPWESEE